MVLLGKTNHEQEVAIDLFTDTVAILNILISQYIMGCTGGKECSRD